MHLPSFTRRRRPPAGFTLVEALVATSMTALAASVLLLGIHSSVQTTDEAIQKTIALGMAQQLMDEVVGGRYAAVGAGGHQVNLGPSSWEQNGSGRERYDDVDDYADFWSCPPEDLWGVELGKDDGEGGQRYAGLQVPEGFFGRWAQKIDVYYVDESDLTTALPYGQVSDYRAVRVRISYLDPQRGWRTVVQLKRVVAYVPPL